VNDNRALTLQSSSESAVRPLAAIVLVLGLLQEPAGKTRVAQRLVQELAEVGFKALHVKPAALLDAYRDWLHLREYGLVAREAVSARELLGAREPAELLNPVAMLTVPVSAKAFYDYGVPQSFFVYQADEARRLVAVRLASPDVGGVKSFALVNPVLLERGLSLVGREEVLGLLKRVEALEEVRDRAQMLSRANALAANAVERCLSRLSERYRVLVVEGYSDGAWPLGSLEARPAAVLAVAPGQVVAYARGSSWPWLARAQG
jgi:Predicted P-loop ATPase/GTPase